MPTPRDVLAHPTYRDARAYWQGELRRKGLACARCGQPIKRTAPRTQWSLDVGHIIGRAEALELGMTIPQINALSNTQPEHAKCNRTSGAHHGASRRWGRPTIATSEPITSGVWGASL